MQIALAILLSALVAVSLSYLYDEVVSTLIGSLAGAVARGDFTWLDAGSITAELEYLKYRSLVLAGTAVLILTVIFAYLIGRLALAPTRSALTSQKQFVGNIAHELRTPLSIIKTNTEVRLMEKDVPPGARAIHESNLEELDRISDIINNLLSINRYLQPERMRFEPVALGAVLEHVRGALGDFAERKGVKFVLASGPYGSAWGNASAIEQIFMNLARNAVSYTAEDGMVTIAPFQAPRGMVGVLVEDTGAGISPKDLERIFEPYYRGDQSRNRRSGGSGLGLAIVSELLKLHRGKIELSSELGKGTRANVTLPLAREDWNPLTVFGRTASFMRPSPRSGDTTEQN